MSSPKIFIAHLREMTERFDPRYHSPFFAENLSRIKSVNWCSLGSCCKLSEETWDKRVLFPDSFPYVEISTINTEDGTIERVETLPTAEAPDRAQMVVRSGDILVSTTRPTRNAIACVPCNTQVAIASTGFAVIREVDTGILSKEYLYHVLRLGFCTAQFDQRSSGGNYPAITKDDLGKVIIPVPSHGEQARIVTDLDAAYAAKHKADAKAAELLASIDSVVLDALGIPPFPPSDTSLPARIFTVSFRDIANRTLAPTHYLKKLDFSTSKYKCRAFCEAVVINPLEQIVDATRPYHLVPMEAVSAEYGCIERVETLQDGNINGYSAFENGDVIFAKISPCMENGKSAVVSTDVGGVIFGSTEFLVFRPKKETITADYLYLLLRMKILRDCAGRNLSGTTGHQRITAAFFRELKIPVPPRAVQEEIVANVSVIKDKAKSLRGEAVANLTAAKSRIEKQLLI